MNSENERLERLLALARKGRPDLSAPDSAQPPLGFTTRVAARWATAKNRRSAADAWERLSWWGSGLAVAACLLVGSLQKPEPELTGFDLLLEMPAAERTF